MVAKIRNGKNGICSSVVHRLMTRAMEQPTMRVPPMSSPQGMLLCSMKTATHSAKLRRGVLGVLGVLGTLGATGAGGSLTRGGSAYFTTGASVARIGATTGGSARGTTAKR